MSEACLHHARVQTVGLMMASRFRSEVLAPFVSLRFRLTLEAHSEGAVWGWFVPDTAGFIALVICVILVGACAGAWLQAWRIHHTWCQSTSTIEF